MRFSTILPTSGAIEADDCGDHIRVGGWPTNEGCLVRAMSGFPGGMDMLSSGGKLRTILVGLVVVLFAATAAQAGGRSQYPNRDLRASGKAPLIGVNKPY